MSRTQEPWTEVLIWICPGNETRNAGRQGVAQRLLRELEGKARWWGQTELLLVVNAQNLPAVRLYEKMGYTRTAGTHHTRSGDVCMRRNLFSPTSHTLQSLLPQFTTVIG